MDDAMVGIGVGVAVALIAQVLTYFAYLLKERREEQKRAGAAEAPGGLWQSCY